MRNVIPGSNDDASKSKWVSHTHGVVSGGKVEGDQS